MASLKEISEAEFKNFLQADDKVRVVKVGATWCAPCQASKGPVAEVAEKLKGNVEIVEIDVDKCPNLGAELMVRGVPLFIKWKGKEEVSRQTGWAGMQGFEDWVKQ